MNFRYSVAKYRTQNEVVNIGVIVQSNRNIDCKFLKDIDKLKEKISGEEHINEAIFLNMENTFKDKFKEKVLTIEDKDRGSDEIIKYTSQDYIKYLSENYLNNYVFNSDGTFEANSLEEALDELYNKFVGSQFRS